jgi:transcription elongation factor Elf1
MSNYYISKCCGEQVTTELKGAFFEYVCQKCHLPCKVIAVLDTPGGVPTADCTVCGREGGHIMPIQDKSVKQYQEDIDAGVEVGSHETMDGWCCACEADIAELNRRLEVQKAEILSAIKGLGC